MAPSLRELAKVDGYNQPNQKVVAFMVRQMEEHLAKLKRVTEGLTPAQLEWQIQTGHNTIGMLLAHCAVAEAYWVCVFDTGMPLEPDGASKVAEVVGIGWDDDGLPAKPGSTHPDTLRGKTLADYYGYLDRTRAASHKVMRSWTDDKLLTTVIRGEKETSMAWVMYHVHEHLVEHCGQIQYIKHLMRDAGVLPPLHES